MEKAVKVCWLQNDGLSQLFTVFGKQAELGGANSSVGYRELCKLSIILCKTV